MKENEELQKEIKLMQDEIFRLKKKIVEMDNDLYGLVSDRDQLFRLYYNKVLRATSVKIHGIDKKIYLDKDN